MFASAPDRRTEDYGTAEVSYVVGAGFNCSVTTDKVVLSAETPQQMHEMIETQGDRNVAVMRAPIGCR
jgi:hypothetical protein